MDILYTICFLISDFIPFLATAAAFIYGIRKFFRKRTALYPQIITMGLACYALGTLHHFCQTLAIEEISDGFTVSYLGHIGFFLFLLAANFGQMDGIVDDRSRGAKRAGAIALLGPALAAVLFLPIITAPMPTSTKITYLLVWLPGLFSIYFNLKHAIIPDMGFGFIKAIRPYNITAVIISFTELLSLLAWAYYDYDYIPVVIAVICIGFSGLSILLMKKLKEGVEKWTI